MKDIELKLFGKAFPSKSNKVTFSEINKIATQLGYIIHPEICNEDVLSWLKFQKIDVNSTFYKKWNDIISKSRFELYVHQLLHYASTYGTGFTGEVFLPEGEVEIPKITNFKVITPITIEEAIERCENMLFSGIALKQETITDILTLLKELNHKIDINKVRNKEAKMILYKELNTVPSEPVEMVRFLVYLTTGDTLLIKNSEVINKIGLSVIRIDKLVEQFGYEKLSSVFLRFKPIFLAFRNLNVNRKVINKLRRLAKKHHSPTAKGLFEQLLTKEFTANQLLNALNNITNFKKIALLQAINVKMKELDNRAFVIRNQKLFIKENNQRVNKSNLTYIYAIIYNNLIESLSDKACKIKLPKGINLTLPVSEKSFVGNYPLGTSFDFANSNNIIGIHWKGKDGATDLDLSLIDIDGKKYGWNAAYKNDVNSIIYSGDMTSAYPEATELFYATKGFRPAIVKVNSYNADDNAKFKFFIAKEKISGAENYGFRNYMVDPNNIVITVDCEMDSKEKTLGVITENQFVLAQFRTGKGRVSYNSVTNLYTEYALNTLDCYLSFEKLLKDSGFTIVEENADIDLTNIQKDTLIDLLTVESKKSVRAAV